jgi:uncharacterized surface protein with fasciclin (FAS1) repeats
MVDQRRRTILKALGGASTLALGGVGMASARKGRRKGASADPTLVELAIETDGFDVLVAAVTEAGLVETLSGNRQLTVFGPTDEAFNAAGITVDNVGEVDDEFLLDVLTYHVTPGRRYAASIVNASHVPTLNGALVNVDGTNLNDEQASIVATDFEASNGVFHAIDGVLLP